ncbi:unnamed protein product [Adineta steineri]|uniref:G-protein coupled receptors family 1 profile domain-containing protein n=1 Tax=Adineta steineri TaxID=433720 RepID=A0A818I5K4_9BILA|nr:unnamed protein product [Adineta steineri]CAF3519410.1 unnamed protein product [Adineta steineri]
MNFTNNDSFLTASNCSLPDRVYTPNYLFFKLLNSTYLRLLIVPAILLNTLCLIVLSRPKLSGKSTTLVFLRFLAVFDILAITLKYIRAEINYQSIDKGHQIFLLIPWVCKTLYVLMNSSISISMWTIVLMSLDKAVAVSYPLQSSIWVTHRRAVYICCITIITLSLANLTFINLSGILTARNGSEYCGLNKDSFIVDLLTASILPMGLITITNIVIAVVLNRVSRVSLNWPTSDDNSKRECEAQMFNSRLSVPSLNYRRSSAGSTVTPTDIVIAAKRRLSAQVTRMLLAVTLSLIICNIPNTIFFVFVKIYDTRQILIGRLCTNVSDNEISLYKFGFYSSVIQDILSDLPHIFNFFLYCLAGKKFRSIFINEVRHFFLSIRFIKHKKDRLTPEHVIHANMRCPSTHTPLSKSKKTMAIFFNGKTTKTILNGEHKNISRIINHDYDKNLKLCQSFTSIQ